MKLCAESDGVILAVRADKDTMPQIRMLAEQMKVAQIPLKGYILNRE